MKYRKDGASALIAYVEKTIDRASLLKFSDKGLGGVPKQKNWKILGFPSRQVAIVQMLCGAFAKNTDIPLLRGKTGSDILSRAEHLRADPRWIPWVALFAQMIEQGEDRIHVVNDLAWMPHLDDREVVAISIGIDLEEMSRELHTIDIIPKWTYIFSDSSNWILCCNHENVSFLFCDPSFCEQLLEKFDYRSEIKRQYEAYLDYEFGENAVCFKALIDWDAL